MREALKKSLLWATPSERSDDHRLTGPLSGSYPRLAERELERILADDRADTVTSGRFAYLRHAPRLERVKPLLSFNYDLTGDVLRAQFYLFLFSEPGRALVLRYESPEVADDAEGLGRHAFYHVQFVPDVPGGRFPAHLAVRVPEGLPASVPAIPLDANCPVSLLGCVLLSLYDHDFLVSMNASSLVRPYLSDLHAHEVRDDLKATLGI